MRRFTNGLAVVVLLFLAKPAFAQFNFGAITKGTPTPATTTTNMSGFLASTMSRPNVMAPVTRPTFPQLSAVSGGTMLPNFQNILMMRNILRPTPTMIGIGQVPPPPKKN